VWFLNNLTFVKATAAQTRGAYGLIESVIPPGFSPPLHIHHREDEAFWILEGEFTIQCGDEMLHGSPGAFVLLPRGVPHSYILESGTPGRMLTLLSPGGGEGFFIDLGRPADSATLPPSSSVDIATLERVAHAYGMEVVGPPMRRSAGQSGT
jgi:mannose-6-phosphate isomerase-like protein (cupin superfamily)